MVNVKHQVTEGKEYAKSSPLNNKFKKLLYVIAPQNDVHIRHDENQGNQTHLECYKSYNKHRVLNPENGIREVFWEFFHPVLGNGKRQKKNAEDINWGRMQYELPIPLVLKTSHIPLTIFIERTFVQEVSALKHFSICIWKNSNHEIQKQDVYNENVNQSKPSENHFLVSCSNILVSTQQVQENYLEWRENTSIIRLVRILIQRRKQ